MKRKWWIIPLAVLLLMAGAFFVYTGIYYHAAPEAYAALDSDDTVTVSKTEYGWFFDGPSEIDALIFYPGGKVEETAYAPFLRLLAEEGLDVCLVRMPFHLAVFGIDRADRILASEKYDYTRWYVGGHSLGGAAAAMFASKHEELSGVILCAAYPTKPLFKEDLELVIYGSEDGVMNRDRLADGTQYATDHVKEYVIEGGNHAQFGNYGVQSGDGEAAVSAAEQQEAAAAFIIENIRWE